MADSKGHFGAEGYRAMPSGVHGGSFSSGAMGGSLSSTNPMYRHASSKVNSMFHHVKPKRKIVDLIEDISENAPRTRGISRVRQAVDKIESSTGNKRRYGKRNAIDNIEDMVNGAKGSARSAIRSVEYGLYDR